MTTDSNPTTDLPGHIISPQNGLRTLCGLRNDVNPYSGLDVAYRSQVEGWQNVARPCRRCLGVALIAMGVSNDVSE